MRKDEFKKHCNGLFSEEMDVIWECFKRVESPVWPTLVDG